MKQQVATNDLRVAKIYKILRSIAGFPAWATKHSADEARFRESIYNLVDELGTEIGIFEFREAFRRYTRHAPMIWPKQATEQDIHRYTQIAMEIINEERFEALKRRESY